MNHSSSGTCRCTRCAAIAAGATPAEADAQYRAWETAQLEKHGWIAHVVEQDPDSPTGFNLHTHYLQERHNHLDFQIVVPLPPQSAHQIVATLAERVKEGEKFQAGQTVAGVIEGGGRLAGQDLLVKLIEATEGGRPVLRVILPDPNGKLDLGEINAQYAVQYAGPPAAPASSPTAAAPPSPRGRRIAPRHGNRRRWS